MFQQMTRTEKTNPRVELSGNIDNEPANVVISKFV